MRINPLLHNLSQKNILQSGTRAKSKMESKIFPLSSSSLRASLGAMLKAQFYTLYYHQELVDRYGVYYDRNRFRRLYQHLQEGYCLFQYRKLVGASQELNPIPVLEYPLRIPANFKFHKILRYFFLLFTLRCVAVVLRLPAFTRTENRRILIGTELLKGASRYIETSYGFWSIITLLYLKFTLTGNILDYRFLALFRMSTGGKNSRKFHKPAAFGLNNKQEYSRFNNFRTGLLWYYVTIVCVIPIIAQVNTVVLYTRFGYFGSHPVASGIWILVYPFWAFWMCTGKL